MFVVNNLESFQTNSSVHGMNTAKKNNLQRPTANLACVQKRVSYSCIKIFNSQTTNILELKNDKLHFKVALQEYLITHSSYSIEDPYTQSSHTSDSYNS
jgi:hypothetical protein